MASLSLNPMATTNALGSFGVQSDGYIQGVALDDPANRFNLAAGTVAENETQPLWGGLPVAENLPGTNSSPRGSTIRRAVSLSGIEGFTVFNQAHNGLTTPQSPVPLYASGMSVSYYRLGSNMRVPLKASPEVVALGTSGASVKTPLAWDFVNSQLTTAASAGFSGADIATTAISYEDGVAKATTASAHGLVAGQYVKISGVAPEAYNGTVIVLSAPTTTSFTYTPAAVPSGPATTQGNMGAVALTDIALPVKLIAIESGNSNTVSYDSVKGFLTWKNEDSCALVLL
ncbi:hypothetical protein BL250_02255 [Erwinia sp. OLTSP20]|uniref:hypothetical protein n=1 Tax=unclassified Erwinia TaxID=2622719 RepID=UPI000C18B834|nr:MULTISPECIES: hypothetical protein [unclassified Erwinia]PIJ48834.1 hypothetical protein BV501_16290 [Erwinia sp. OAMSP11]PIJ69456.1 hypothetical protein BK416_15230 [Erwinia sp. OLSSP12]PIJ79290.1 hypothetical protein BLD47_15535 [Erwinia sp. OLCASP19]PIJ80816.1 hypothetical protein BLD46_14695 [Erwinia sp. OLMTSP26]PIJ82968.1 hypothetical protein BLD49_14590 [Erwinia sp. OLMDSP33]